MRTSRFLYLATPVIGLSEDERNWSFYYAYRGLSWALVMGYPYYSPGLSLAFTSAAGLPIDTDITERAKRKAIELCDTFLVIAYTNSNVGLNNDEVKRDMKRAVELGKRVLAIVPKSDGLNQFRFQRLEK